MEEKNIPQLDELYNKDNIFIRNITIGILDVLNRKIEFNQVWNNENEEIINVPFFYNIGNSDSERFMQDYYTFFQNTCDFPKKIDGNFDVIPRGSVSFNGWRVQDSNTSNRFVEGRFNKIVDGEVKTYVSYLYSIPINVNYTIDIVADTLTQQLKIEQGILEAFYKTKIFYVYFNGMRISCQVGFPETYNDNPLMNYSYSTDAASKQKKISFELSIETYYPSFDRTTMKELNSRIKGFGYDIHVMDGDDKRKIFPITQGNITISKNIPLWLEWNYIGDNADMLMVDILYVDTETGKENIIEQGTPNHLGYLWKIPQFLTNYQQPDIIFDDNVGVIIPPEIIVIPDLFNNVIDKSSIKVESSGTFATNNVKRTTVGIYLEYKNKYNQIIRINETPIFLNLVDGYVDLNNPVEDFTPISLLDKDGNLYLDIQTKVIDIIIRDSVHNNINCTISNICII